MYIMVRKLVWTGLVCSHCFRMCSGLDASGTLCPFGKVAEQGRGHQRGIIAATPNAGALSHTV